MRSVQQLEDIIAEAYQVVGHLAHCAGLSNDPQVIRSLDVLSGRAEGSMLPFRPAHPERLP